MGGRLDGREPTQKCGYDDPPSRAKVATNHTTSTRDAGKHPVAEPVPQDTPHSASCAIRGIGC